MFATAPVPESATVDRQVYGMRVRNSGWVVASVEAFVIVALAIVVFAPASIGHRVAAPVEQVGTTGGPAPARASAMDLDAVRAIVRSELDAQAERRTASPAPPAAPRDLALDHLRKTRIHHELDDYLRKGVIAQQDLDALQEQSMLLEERDQEAALSRLARAINQQQLRVQP